MQTLLARAHAQRKKLPKGKKAVGNANLLTCPKCGQPMRARKQGGGDRISIQPTKSTMGKPDITDVIICSTRQNKVIRDKPEC